MRRMPFLFVHIERGVGWFRVWGWGLHYRDTRRYPLLYSERNHLRLVWLLGAWAIKPLYRRDMQLWLKVMANEEGAA